MPALPRLPREVVARPRLVAELERPTPLTVVRGPAGVGKTTLLAHWLEHRADDGEPHRWVDLERTTEAAVVWAAVRDALAAAPRTDAGADPGLATPTTVAGASPADQVRRLVDDLPTAVRLVLDGLDAVRDEPGLVADLVDLTRRSRQLRLVVATRDTRAVDAADTLGVDATVLAPPDVLLDEDEHRRLVATVAPELHPDQVDRLFAVVGGWPALTRAAARALDPRAGATAVDHEGLAAAERHLRAAVLPADLDRATWDAVVATAALDPVTTDAAAVATGLADPSPVLTLLERHGLAYPVHDGDGPALQLPVAVRSVLRRQLLTQPADVVRRRETDLARWFADRDRPELALRHACAAEDWDLVVALLDEHFAAFVVHHDAPLRAALDALPARYLDQRPVLREAAVLLRDVPLRGGTQPALLPLDPTGLEPDLPDAELRDRISRAFMQTVALRMGGRAAASVEMAARVRATVDGLPPERRAVIDYAPVLLAQLGVTRVLGADLAGAEDDFLACYSEATAAGDQLFAYDAATYEALLRALAADVDGATTWLERATGHRFEVPADWLAPVIGTSGDVAAVLVATDRLDRDAAERALAELNDPTGRDELWALIVHAQARAALLWGDRFGMLARIARARAAHPGRDRADTLAHRLLVADTADLLLALGQAVRAERLLATQGDGSPVIAVRRARLALLTGRLDDAVVSASPFVWRDDVADRERLELLLVLALAELARGDEAAARLAADRAGSLLAVTGLRAVLAELPAGGRAQLAGLLPDPRVLDEPDHASAVGEVFPARLRTVDLTAREQRVLEELVEGHTLETIGSLLHVSLNTVKTQVRSIYRKLGVGSRQEAVVTASELGLVGDPAADERSA